MCALGQLAARCQWCGRSLPAQQGLGRRRQYCRRSCRQRAFESRQRAAASGLPDGAVLLRAEQYQELSDRLYQVRCAAQDVHTALEEGATPAELTELVAAVIELADQAAIIH